MECITEVVFDVGSLYAHFQEMKDMRKAKGVRYRGEQFIEMLKLKRTIVD